MYPAKKAKFTELLTNALSLPTSRSASFAKHEMPIPTRREEAIQRSLDEQRAQRESYFAAARLLWWNR
jgi:hypothetical protein